MLKLHRGFTLVELLVVMTITAVLMTFGVSAYGRAQHNQTVAANAQKILIALGNAQNQANIGSKDCAGAFVGVQVTVANGGSTITSRAVCQGNVYGAVTSSSLTSATFNTSGTILFKPLSSGVNVGGGSSINVDFTSEGAKYRVTVTNTGNITYVGGVSS